MWNRLADQLDRQDRAGNLYRALLALVVFAVTLGFAVAGGAVLSCLSGQ